MNSQAQLKCGAVVNGTRKYKWAKVFSGGGGWHLVSGKLIQTIQKGL